jgi:tetratricopeptide (TPR) repeat protein
VPIGERIEEWRDRMYESGERIIRKFLPDLAGPPERGDHKEAVVTLERGRKAYNAKNYPRAEELFRQAVLSDEAYSKAHYYLGLALYKQGDSQGAQRAWKRATEVDPTGSMGLKAQRKLGYMRKGTDRVINELRERINDRRK